MGEGPTRTRRSAKSRVRYYAAIAAAAVTGAGVAVGATAGGASAAPHAASSVSVPASSLIFGSPTVTPIKHLVVIFDENVSFDHYFGTYPFAANTDGSAFHAKSGTPTVNGLHTSITSSGPTGPLLTDNPNVDNGVQYNPTRLTHSQALTCDQDHAYTPEQEAVNGGKMDKFIQFTNTPTCTGTPTTPYGAPGLVMDYFDGNTVTGLWNYAQNYALGDNNFDTEFGPSTPGALNLISGQTG
jgi:phospholipase C